jgi:hypothetical protein
MAKVRQMSLRVSKKGVNATKFEPEFSLHEGRLRQKGKNGYQSDIRKLAVSMKGRIGDFNRCVLAILRF